MLSQHTNAYYQIIYYKLTYQKKRNKNFTVVAENKISSK